MTWHQFGWISLERIVKNQGGKFWCELYDERFMHYRAGGNWEHLDRSVHDERIRGLR